MSRLSYGRPPYKPTRFPKGINNALPTETLNNLASPDPTKLYTDFDDFNTYLATDWTITTTGTGTRALGAGAGGLLVVTNSAALNDANFYQRTVASFVPTANKRTFFKARFKVDDATAAVVQMGLILTDTTPLDATDGIYFLKANGSTAIQAFVRKDATTGSTTNSNIGTLVNDTYITLGFEYNGKDAVLFYVDDAMVARLSASSTYLPDAALALSFGVSNGTAVARAMTLDYIFGASER